MDASVVVPAFDKRRALARTLAGFAHQTWRGPFEVIVVDDGSTDGTREWLASYPAPFSLRVIPQANLGRSAARNRGIQEASGDYVLFNDADTIPGPTFIEGHLRAHGGSDDTVVNGAKYHVLADWQKTPELAAVAARLLPDLDPGQIAARVERADGWVEFFSADEVAADFEVVRRHLVAEARHNYTSIVAAFPDLSAYRVAWTLLITQNASVARPLLERVGGFDERFVGYGYEDSELGLRLQDAGGRFFYAPDGLNYHQMHPGIWSRPETAARCWSELAANYRRLLDMHPRLDVYLHWRFVVGLLGAARYHELLEAHEQCPRQIQEDQVATARALALLYCALPDPSPRGLGELAGLQVSGDAPLEDDVTFGLES
jgi:GT2 family glycosyltransferase